MSIIVTGSIAFDYLMSFPGKFTEHFLPEHMNRVSLSFLVDTMDKRRGGCAPNIAYTLALLGERPRLMATAGQDFDDYRRWLEAAGIDTSLVKSWIARCDATHQHLCSRHNDRYLLPEAHLSFIDVEDLCIVTPPVDPKTEQQHVTYAALSYVWGPWPPGCRSRPSRSPPRGWSG